MKTKVKFSNHIRAVSTDKRPLISEIESIAASMKNLSGPEKLSSSQRLLTPGF
jgi:hypothetical protein